MTTREVVPDVWAMRKAAWTHERRVLHSRQHALPVLYQGRERFIATFYLGKNDDEATIHLNGSPDPVRPCDLTFPEPVV